jgi:Mg/Co/Ni transporter MgtE
MQPVKHDSRLMKAHGIGLLSGCTFGTLAVVWADDYAASTYLPAIFGVAAAANYLMALINLISLFQVSYRKEPENDGDNQ